MRSQILLFTRFVWMAATTGAQERRDAPPQVGARWNWRGVLRTFTCPIEERYGQNGFHLARRPSPLSESLPSSEDDEYLFPADQRQRPLHGQADAPLGHPKSFQAACRRAGLKDLRIHDLRHMATTILFLSGIPEAIIRKLTGHRSRELERYEHLSPGLKSQTVELIAHALSEKSTATDTPPLDDQGSGSEVIEKIGGDDGARTRDLRRDRPAF